jgi:tetraprenyl-beta-curcumene synthase
MSAPRPPVSLPVLLWRSFARVLPLSSRELRAWRERAGEIPDPELRGQALASLELKRFHSDGGSVFATGAPPGAERENLVRLIVAFQTISDYLDNLCDRSTSLDPEDFRRLHRAMTDAVDPSAPPPGHYYEHHPQQDDAGYLDALVGTCQQAIGQLPGYGAVAPPARELVGLYCDLQVHKHVRVEDRVPRLTEWFGAHRELGPELEWWEFSAATGSTLGVFALFCAALDEAVPAETVQRIRAAYFPWVGGLHILLDYLIDQDEDRDGGDLNFVAQYPSRERAEQRIEMLARRALAEVERLPAARFHRLVIQGLVGMYLSDTKALRDQRLLRFGLRLTARAGPVTAVLHGASRAYRRRADL